MASKGCLKSRKWVCESLHREGGMCRLLIITELKPPKEVHHTSRSVSQATGRASQATCEIKIECWLVGMVGSLDTDTESLNIEIINVRTCLDHAWTITG